MVDIAKIEKLMVLMSKHGFDVIQAESSDEKFSLARNASQAHFFSPSPGYSIPSGSHYSQSGSSSSKNISFDNIEENNNNVSSSTEVSSSSNVETPPPVGEIMTSPFVGTFYRSSSPDSPTFVEVGSKVKKGQALCIVEAMKLMNEIESEVDGEVVAILVDNAKPVEFGTPLFIIAPIK